MKEKDLYRVTVSLQKVKVKKQAGIGVYLYNVAQKKG